MNLRFEQIRDILSKAIGSRAWVVDFDQETVIYQHDDSRDFYEAPYQISENLTASIGQAQKVERIVGYLALNFELSSDGSLPQRIELIPAGPVVTGRDGRAWRNDNPQRIVDFMNNQGRDLVVDFEHATELKAPKGDKAPAAAWLNDFALDAAGVVTAAVNSWTPDGESAVKNKEYRYISPAIDYSKATGQILGISSVALTNKPNFHLPALNSQQKENTMDLKALLKKLGLPEDATIEQALNAVGKLQGDLETALNRQQVPDLQKFVPRADYDQAVGRATNAEQKLKEKLDADLEEDITAEIDGALKSGKIAPVSKDFYTAMCRQEGGLDQFKKFLETAPAIADPSGLDDKDPNKNRETALNAEQKQIAEMFGNSAEDLQKYGS